MILLACLAVLSDIYIYQYIATAQLELARVTTTNRCPIPLL